MSPKTESLPGAEPDFEIAAEIAVEPAAELAGPASLVAVEAAWEWGQKPADDLMAPLAFESAFRAEDSLPNRVASPGGNT